MFALDRDSMCLVTPEVVYLQVGGGVVVCRYIFTGLPHYEGISDHDRVSLLQNIKMAKVMQLWNE
jgi:hypothetical protein